MNLSSVDVLYELGVARKNIGKATKLDALTDALEEKRVFCLFKEGAVGSVPIDSYGYDIDEIVVLPKRIDQDKVAKFEALLRNTLLKFEAGTASSDDVDEVIQAFNDYEKPTIIGQCGAPGSRGRRYDLADKIRYDDYTKRYINLLRSVMIDADDRKMSRYRGCFGPVTMLYE